MSAISFVHKLVGLPDPSGFFLVQKIIRGIHSRAAKVDSRLPITKGILIRLLDALEFIEPLLPHRLLLEALFLTAFQGFFRLGELASKAKDSNVVQRNDLTLNKTGALIIIRHHKTGVGKPPVSVSFAPWVREKYCPVAALTNYLAHCQQSTGPLFQHLDGKAVTQQFVSCRLRAAVSFIGLNPSHYKGHSFRIGAATHAASLGMSNSLIQQFGR
ncbi:integrase/recombinase xerD homolog [Antedon mediterranea]|uniref:integrase/recombinase xerD homolog n=1 Tax=Antedon mediterranea TaxID=105859 RepID=UPI003AF454B9